MLDVEESILSRQFLTAPKSILNDNSKFLMSFRQYDSY
jgi:hypothetical protein